MNRRKFLGFVGHGRRSIILPSCTTTPITERKQLKLISEAKLNAQAARIYEEVKKKETLSDDKKTLDQIKEIGRRMECQLVNIFYNLTFKILQ